MQYLKKAHGVLWKLLYDSGDNFSVLTISILLSYEIEIFNCSTVVFQLQ